MGYWLGNYLLRYKSNAYRYFVEFLRFLSDIMRSKVFRYTVLPAIDGNILSLASSGILSIVNPSIVVFTGLTCIAGVGAWTATIEEYGMNSNRSISKLLATALITTIAVVTVCFVGSIVSLSFDLTILRYFSSIVVFMIALEIMGIRIPERVPYTPIPTTLFIILIGILLEMSEVIGSSICYRIDEKIILGGLLASLIAWMTIIPLAKVDFTKLIDRELFRMFGGFAILTIALMIAGFNIPKYCPLAIVSVGFMVSIVKKKYRT